MVAVVLETSKWFWDIHLAGLAGFGDELDRMVREIGPGFCT